MWQAANEVSRYEVVEPRAQRIIREDRKLEIKDRHDKDWPRGKDGGAREGSPGAMMRAFEEDFIFIFFIIYLTALSSTNNMLTKGRWFFGGGGYWKSGYFQKIEKEKKVWNLMRLEFLCDLNLTAGQRMIVGKDIRGGGRGIFGSKWKLGSGGMNNAKWKKANKGSERERGTHYIQREYLSQS